MLATLGRPFPTRLFSFSSSLSKLGPPAGRSRATSSSSSTWSSPCKPGHDPSSWPEEEELLVYPQDDPIVQQLLRLRPTLKAIPSATSENKEIRWHLVRKGLQADSLTLEPHYLGKKKLSDEETATIWEKSIQRRLGERILLPGSPGPGTEGYYSGCARLQLEVAAALRAVEMASYISRAYQRTFSTPEKVEKSDDSPVTVADFAVQAVVLDYLHRLVRPCPCFFITRPS